MVSDLINANPTVYEKRDRRTRTAPNDVDEYAAEPIDQLEIFDILFCLIMSEILSLNSLYVASYILLKN